MSDEQFEAARTLGIHPYDLQTADRMLVPLIAPLRELGRSRPQPPPLGEPEPGYVWVRLDDDYYQGMQWWQVMPGDRIDTAHVRQIPAQTLVEWDLAESAHRVVQEEAWALYIKPREAA